MSRKEDEAFQKWADELAEKVEPAEADAFKVWAKTDAAREVFRGTIGQAELYRRMNEVATEKKEIESARAELQTWYDEEAPKNAELLKERDELKAQLAELGLGGPPPAASTPGPTLSSEELEGIKAKLAKVEALDRLIPAVLADSMRIGQDAAKNDFDYDPNEVIQYSLKQGVEPWRAYQILTRDERERRAAKAHDEEKKKWIEEGRRQALTNNSPDHLQPSGPSVVDYLKDLNKQTGAAASGPDKDSRVSSAMKEFIEGNF
jgi:hypothetical protein